MHMSLTHSIYDYITNHARSQIKYCIALERCVYNASRKYMSLPSKDVKQTPKLMARTEASR